MNNQPYTMVRNIETGEVFRATTGPEWKQKFAEWRAAMAKCNHDPAACPIPSPMPVGHIMFYRSAKRRGSLYAPVA